MLATAARTVLATGLGLLGIAAGQPHPIHPHPIRPHPTSKETR